MTLFVEHSMSQVLDTLRWETDAFAATCVPARPGAGGQLHKVVRGDDLVGPQSDYINDTSDPTRHEFARLIDPVKVRHAQRFFATYGLQIAAGLLCKALPDSYAAARGAQVLYLTGELVSNPARRVRETTQFVLNVMTPPAQFAENEKAPTTLSPGQPGALAARRIRMFHQFVRNAVDGEWAERWKRIGAYFQEVAPDGPPLGKPLNQEDLLGTLHEFTVGVFESLNVLGVPYTADDEEAWFHVWDVIGCHMGIGTESAFEALESQTVISATCKYFLRLDPKGSAATLDEIRRRHRMESHEGTILTNALLAALERPLERGMKPFPASLMRYLLGDETANLLGISQGGWIQQWLLSLNGVPRVAEIVARRRKGAIVRLTTSELSAMATQRLLQAFVEEGRTGGRTFEVASHLRNAWGLGEEAPLRALPRRPLDDLMDAADARGDDGGVRTEAQ